MRIALLLVVALFGSVGCDSKAKASDPPGRADAKSKEYESCGATLHCDDNLRCFSNVCRRQTRSTVGDYFAALGASPRTDAGAAISAYQSALGHYDSEKVALPPDVDCGYGAALARDAGNKEHAELAARVLHRCVLAVPVGSALRDQALAALATLSGAGLNPLALGGAKLADVYMTGSAAPAAPTTAADAMVTPNPLPTGASFHVVTDKLAEPDVKAALVACGSTYKASAKKDLSVVVGVKAVYVPSQYDDEDGHFAIAIDPPTALPAGTPEASADTCVHGVVDPAIKGLQGVRDNFATKLTIAVK